MSNEDRDEQGGLVSLLAGVGVGVILGGALALLLAPQSGRETRTQLRESADDALGRLRDSMDDLRTKVEEISANARGGASRSLEAAGPRHGDVAGATDDSSASQG